MESIAPISKIYIDNPGSYLLKGDAGMGKSTQLRQFCIDMISGCFGDIIPIFLKMYQMNRVSSERCEGTPITNLLLYQGFYNIGYKAEHFYDMMEKHPEKTFVFVLDGLNEVHDRIVGNDYLIDLIRAEIKELIKRHNVDFIISSRTESVLIINDHETVEESIYLTEVKNMDNQLASNKIRVISLEGLVEGYNLSENSEGIVEFNKGLDEEKVCEYLGIELEEIPSEIREELVSPMMLKAYKVIPEGKKKTIKSKTALLSEYFNWIINQDLDYSRREREKRENVLYKWIPRISFKVEILKLENDININKAKENRSTLHDLIVDIFEELEQDEDDELSFSVNEIIEIIKKIDICDEDLHFQHDIIREYFAVKGLFLYMSKKAEYGTGRASSFIELLEKNIRRGRRFEIERQTRNIGLVEILYELVLDKRNLDLLFNGYALSKHGDYDSNTNSRDYRAIFEVFFDYMSMLDDLNESKKASIVGNYLWAMLDQDKRESVFESYGSDAEYKGCVGEFHLVEILNDIAYSTNNYELSYSSFSPLEPLMKAEEILDRIMNENDDNKKQKEYVNKKGVILNNYGAFYYGAYKRDYKKALEYHLVAKKYREEKREEYIDRFDIDIVPSYRAISSDYYMLAEETKDVDPAQSLMYYRKADAIFDEYHKMEGNSENFIMEINYLGNLLSLFDLLAFSDCDISELKRISGEIGSAIKRCKCLLENRGISRRKLIDYDLKYKEKMSRFQRICESSIESRELLKDIDWE